MSSSVGSERTWSIAWHFTFDLLFWDKNFLSYSVLLSRGKRGTDAVNVNRFLHGPSTFSNLVTYKPDDWERPPTLFATPICLSITHRMAVLGCTRYPSNTIPTDNYVLLHPLLRPGCRFDKECVDILPTPTCRLFSTSTITQSLDTLPPTTTRVPFTDLWSGQIFVGSVCRLLVSSLTGSVEPFSINFERKAFADPLFPRFRALSRHNTRNKGRKKAAAISHNGL